jgi:outer membrane protein assembly factor BamA
MRVFIVFTILFFSASLFAQNDTISTEKSGKKKEIRKKGWNFLPFPYLTFDTDLGVEFGASCSAVDFGNGDIYPKAYHLMFLSASIYTKGSATLMFNYESDYLIKGIKTLFDVAYLPDMAFDFYGFNGYEAVYNADWRDDKSPDYKSRLFYKLKRKMLRIRTTFQGQIGRSNFKWQAGFELYNVNMASLNIDRLNKGKDEDKMLPAIDSVPPIYNRYIHWGLIPENQKDGGLFSILKAGIVYDTRDNEMAPMKGIWAEATFVGAPKFMSTMDDSFMKLVFYWRHYVPIVKNHLSLAYRLNYQGTIAGSTPWYAQTFKFNSVANGLYNEGLGGGKTIRGVLRNRVVGDGSVMGNFELRYAFWKFIVFKQNIDMVVSGFFDTGRVVQYIDVEDIIENLTESEIDYKNEGDKKSDYFDLGAEKFHNAAGGGLHIIVNHNIVVAFDFAKAFNKQDNDGLGVYIGSYFLF